MVTIKTKVLKNNKILFIGFILMFIMLLTFNIIWYNQSRDLNLKIANLRVGNYTEEVRPYNLSYKYVNDLLYSCDSDMLSDRIECIVDNNIQFKFITRADSEELSVEDLINEGGDCESWATFYESIASYYNYSFTPVLIKLNDESFHRFTIIYDETGYCYVDMTNVNCVKYLFDE